MFGMVFVKTKANRKCFSSYEAKAQVIVLFNK